MPGGRPAVELTEERAKVIVSAAAAGCPRSTCAGLAGISRTTLDRWLARGRRAGRGKFWKLREDLKREESLYIAKNMRDIRRAGEGDGDRPGQWQALAWLLERRHPDLFALNRREVKELREQLSELLKAIADGRLSTATPGGPPAPQVGGDADPAAV